MDKLLNADDYSLLWHACKDGHLDLVKALMTYEFLLFKKAPDGTSPHFMAFIKGHEAIADYLECRFGYPVEYRETKPSETDSFIIRLTEKYPIFNDKVERAFKYKIPPSINYTPGSANETDFKTHILGTLCPLADVNNSGEEKDDVYLYLGKINAKECEEDCSK